MKKRKAGRQEGEIGCPVLPGRRTMDIIAATLTSPKELLSFPCPEFSLSLTFLLYLHTTISTYNPVYSLKTCSITTRGDTSTPSSLKEYLPFVTPSAGWTRHVAFTQIVLILWLESVQGNGHKRATRRCYSS